MPISPVCSTRAPPFMCLIFTDFVSKNHTWLMCQTRRILAAFAAASFSSRTQAILQTEESPRSHCTDKSVLLTCKIPCMQSRGWILVLIVPTSLFCPSVVLSLAFMTFSNVVILSVIDAIAVSGSRYVGRRPFMMPMLCGGCIWISGIRTYQTDCQGTDGHTLGTCHQCY